MRQDELSRNSYEICYDPEAGTAFVYRYVRGGICGPMTGRRAVEDRQGAEAEALRHDLVRTGPWKSASNGNQYAEAQKISPTP